MKNVELGFEAIGTTWQIELRESGVSGNKLQTLILERVEEFDKTYSRFRKDSLIWKISEKAGEYIFPKDSQKLFALYGELYQITDGAFTLLIGNALDEAGYDASYSFKQRKIHKVPDTSSIYSFDYPKLKVKKPYILDFGGLGKGYLIDIIFDLLLRSGTQSFYINAGGDIRCHNLNKPLRVGLENPYDFKQVIGVASIENTSICASAGSRRKWGEFHHIIDPKTLSSPQNILASWVISKDAITSDGLATCLFLTSAKKLKNYFDFEYLILYPDFSTEKSKNFPAELFINNVK